jgi:hypothetical protein
MAIDYMEVMEVFGTETAKHPATTKLIMDTKALWEQYPTMLQQVQAEYLRAKPQATGFFDQLGIILQIMALHPAAEPLVKQTLQMWDGHLGDLIHMLDEIQAAAVEANKT